MAQSPSQLNSWIIQFTEMACIEYIYLSFPERSEGNEVMKIAVRDDKCFGGRKDFGGAEMVQGAQPRRSSLSVCLSVTMRTSPRFLVRLH